MVAGRFHGNSGEPTADQERVARDVHLQRELMGQRTTVSVAYEVSGAFILGWFIETAFFSLITLGLYLPVGLNSLVKYLCDCTEVQIHQSQVDGK